MPDHYYTQIPSSESRPEQFEVSVFGQTLGFESDAGVFSKGELDYGSRLLLLSLPALAGRVLDLGCGWGGIGVALAAKHPECRLVLSDINERAVALARKNAARNRLNNVEVVLSDGFSNVEGAFDAIISNPPIRAGKQVIYGLFGEAKNRLKSGSSLFVVIRKQQGAPSALAHLQEVYGDARLIERSKGFWIIQATKGEGE